MSGYFYWCGIVLNGILALGFLIGIGFSIAAWIEGFKEDLKDGRNTDGAEFERTNPVTSGAIGRDRKQP